MGQTLKNVDSNQRNNLNLISLAVVGNLGIIIDGPKMVVAKTNTLCTHVLSIL